MDQLSVLSMNLCCVIFSVKALCTVSYSISRSVQYAFIWDLFLLGIPLRLKTSFRSESWPSGGGKARNYSKLRYHQLTLDSTRYCQISSNGQKANYSGLAVGHPNDPNTHLTGDALWRSMQSHDFGEYQCRQPLPLVPFLLRSGLPASLPALLSGFPGQLWVV